MDFSEYWSDTREWAKDEPITIQESTEQSMWLECRDGPYTEPAISPASLLQPDTGHSTHYHLKKTTTKKKYLKCMLMNVRVQYLWLRSVAYALKQM